MKRKSYENSRERFINVAEARTNAVLDRIRILGNCSNPHLYKYTPDEINKIFKTLDDELLLTKQKFSIKTKNKNKFRL